MLFDEFCSVMAVILFFIVLSVALFEVSVTRIINILLQFSFYIFILEFFSCKIIMTIIL